jgi:hypothetical protein
MARRPDSAAPSTRHPSQLLALAIGAVYTLIGILGFFITGFDNFAAETDKTLLGFEINPLHNLVHLAIGLAGLALWRRLDTARTYGWLAGRRLRPGLPVRAVRGRQQRHQLPVPQRRRQRPAPGQRRRRAGHRPLAGAADRPPRPRRPGRLTRATSGGEPAQQPLSIHFAPLRTPLDVAAGEQPKGTRGMAPTVAAPQGGKR